MSPDPHGKPRLKIKERISVKRKKTATLGLVSERKTTSTSNPEPKACTGLEGNMELNDSALLLPCQAGTPRGCPACLKWGIGPSLVPRPRGSVTPLLYC